MVNNLPAMQETWVRSLGQKDTLEKGIAAHSNILAWRILWTEESGGLQSTGLQRVQHDLGTEQHSPQVYWRLRIGDINPSDTTLLLHH